MILSKLKSIVFQSEKHQFNLKVEKFGEFMDLVGLNSKNQENAHFGVKNEESEQRNIKEDLLFYLHLNLKDVMDRISQSGVKTSKVSNFIELANQKPLNFEDK